jgi:adenosylcobinamide kinase/adenosylcobinamide-phosphate guanylyltransferase
MGGGKMEKKIILVTGGCRSGKSRFALDYANQHFSKKLYLATCEALDEEMAQRIAHHKKTRGPEWRTIEEPTEIVDKIRRYGDEVEVILLDCITLWLSNLLMRRKDDSEIMKEISFLIDTIREKQTSLIFVSNEVGLGIVPADPLSRRFRDLSGMTNQKIAEAANTAIFMVSGIPIFLKGEA